MPALRLVLLFGALFTATVAYDNGSPHSLLPPLGWSSWVALGPGSSAPVFDYCDESSVLNAVDAFVSLGFLNAGFTHFHLDDCWAGGRNATGFLYPETDHFPNGMKKIVDYAHSKGLVFGLYTCAGTETCVGGRPGSKGHWAQDAAVWAEWGVDWVKMDWCNTEGMIPELTYPLMSTALNATGRHIHFNMCEWGLDNPWVWGNNISQSWRMGDDHTPVWSSTKAIIASSAVIPAKYTGKPFGWNDMDMLETGNYGQAAHANGKEGNMTATEYKTEFSMWAISASPLIVTTPIMNCSSGTCIPAITDLQKEILFNTEVIAINQDVTPQGRPVVDGDLTVWARFLSDGSVAVAFYNQEDTPLSIGFQFSQLGGDWGAGTVADVRDLWAHADLGHVIGSVANTTVAPHAAVVLRITPM